MNISNHTAIIDMKSPEINNLRDNCKDIRKIILTEKEKEVRKLHYFCNDIISTEVEANTVKMNILEVSMAFDMLNIKKIYRQYLDVVPEEKRESFVTFNTFMDLFFSY